MKKRIKPLNTLIFTPPPERIEEIDRNYEHISKHIISIKKIYNYKEKPSAYASLLILKDHHNLILNKDEYVECSNYNDCFNTCFDKTDEFERIDYKDIVPHNLLKDIKKNVVENRIVLGGIRIPVSIVSERTKTTGLVDYSWLTEYQHGIAIIGFDDDMEHQQYKGCLIFANSWGTSWGNKGIGYLPYRYILHKKSSDFWIYNKIE